MGKTYTYTPALLEQLRRNAQRLKRDLGIPLNEAQNRIAAEHGFRNWSLLSKQCLTTKSASTSAQVTATSVFTALPAQGAQLQVPSLPVAILLANEVVEQFMVNMSVADLDHATKNNQFYAVALAGGRAFPTWQFVAPVPDMLRDVIETFGEHRTEIHAFVVTAQDELNELAPGEVLAGVPFAGRPALHPSQVRILKLPTATRKERVLEVAQDYVEEASLRRGLSRGS